MIRAVGRPAASRLLQAPLVVRSFVRSDDDAPVLLVMRGNGGKEMLDCLVVR